ncbi:MAG: disulfide bond formation protein DsbB [Alcaligenaceae bacterium]|nr:MAG: disulfide bond formation protein DsbB [Alcaligenaceae bacterium]
MISLKNSRNSLTTTLSTWLNLLALLAICGSLLAAFYYQIALNELPCPLCQLQRVALTLAGIGMMLNIRFGASNIHYAMILASALVGAATSLRQVLLHIAPGDQGYGSALFGLHFYTWGFISFVVTIAFCAVMLCIDRHPVKPSRRNTSGLKATAVIILFLALTAANTVSSVMVCQFGPCPDNPTQYLWKF